MGGGNADLGQQLSQMQQSLQASNIDPKIISSVLSNTAVLKGVTQALTQKSSPIENIITGSLQGFAQQLTSAMSENKQIEAAKEIARIKAGVGLESPGERSQRLTQAQNISGSMGVGDFANSQMSTLRRLQDKVRQIRGL